MKKQYAFYITNHGFGHASRNIPIIEGILEKEPQSVIHVKTDEIRIEFIRKNLARYKENVIYYTGYQEVGLLLRGQNLEFDTQQMEKLVREDEIHWTENIEKESLFLKSRKIDMVVVDIIAWVLIAAKRCNVPSLLLCNFTWYEMYREFLSEGLCAPYLQAYQMANKIFLYEFGNSKIKEYNTHVEQISMVSRKIDKKNVVKIRDKYMHPLIFVSVGKSIEMQKKYDVSAVAATFIITTGVQLEGENVIKLPEKLICTQDYIAASDYVITKSGWSSLGEIFLNKKKAAIIPRGDNSEDRAVINAIKKNRSAVEMKFEDLQEIELVIERLNAIDENALSVYKDDCYKIVRYIVGEDKRDGQCVN